MGGETGDYMQMEKSFKVKKRKTKLLIKNQAWWHLPLNVAPRRKRQANLFFGQLGLCKKDSVINNNNNNRDMK